MSKETDAFLREAKNEWVPKFGIGQVVNHVLGGRLIVLYPKISGFSYVCRYFNGEEYEAKEFGEYELVATEETAN